jgi:hypothetical protein
MVKTDLEASVRVLVAPFFAAPGGPDRVFVAECCGRVLVATKAPTKCRTCGKEVTSRAITREEFQGS